MSIFRRKHYLALAHMMHGIRGGERNRVTILDLCAMLKVDRPNFDIDRFVALCNGKKLKRTKAMGRRKVEPDTFVPPVVDVVSDSDPWVNIKLDTGSRCSDGRKPRSIYYLSYNLNLGRWKLNSDYMKAKDDQQFINRENEIIDLIFKHKGE